VIPIHDLNRLREMLFDNAPYPIGSIGDKNQLPGLIRPVGKAVRPYQVRELLGRQQVDIIINVPCSQTSGLSRSLCK